MSTKAHREMIRQLLGLTEELGANLRDVSAQVVRLRNGHAQGTKGRDDLAEVQVSMLSLHPQLGHVRNLAEQLVRLSENDAADASRSGTERTTTEPEPVPCPTPGPGPGLLASLHRAGDFTLDGED